MHKKDFLGREPRFVQLHLRKYDHVMSVSSAHTRIPYGPFMVPIYHALYKHFDTKYYFLIFFSNSRIDVSVDFKKRL